MSSAGCSTNGCWLRCSSVYRECKYLCESKQSDSNPIAIQWKSNSSPTRWDSGSLDVSLFYICVNACGTLLIRNKSFCILTWRETSSSALHGRIRKLTNRIIYGDTSGHVFNKHICIWQLGTTIIVNYPQSCELHIHLTLLPSRYSKQCICSNNVDIRASTTAYVSDHCLSYRLVKKLWGWTCNCKCMMCCRAVRSECLRRATSDKQRTCCQCM